jgi:hypothetical protein
MANGRTKVKSSPKTQHMRTVAYSTVWYKAMHRTVLYRGMDWTAASYVQYIFTIQRERERERAERERRFRGLHKDNLSTISTMFCPFSFCHPHADDDNHVDDHGHYDSDDDDANAYSPRVLSSASLRAGGGGGGIKSRRRIGSRMMGGGRSRDTCYGSSPSKTNSKNHQHQQEHEERIRQLKHACQWRSAEDPSTRRIYYFHLKTHETTWEKVRNLAPFWCDPMHVFCTLHFLTIFGVVLVSVYWFNFIQPIELTSGAEREQLMADLKAQQEWFAQMEANVVKHLSQGVLPGNVVAFDPNEPVRTRDWALRSRYEDEEDGEDDEDEDMDELTREASKSYYSECEAQAQPCSALGAVSTVRTSSNCSSEDASFSSGNTSLDTPPATGLQQRRNKTRRQRRSYHSHVRTISSMGDKLLLQLKSSHKSGTSATGTSTNTNMGTTNTISTGSQKLPPLQTIFSGEENNGWAVPSSLSSPEVEAPSRAMTPSNVQDIFRGPRTEDSSSSPQYQQDEAEAGSGSESDQDLDLLKFTKATVLLEEACIDTGAGAGQENQETEGLVIHPTAVKVGALRDSCQAPRSTSVNGNNTKKTKALNIKKKFLHSRSHTVTGGANAILYTGTTMMSPDDDNTITCICGVYRAHVVAASLMEDDKLDLDMIFNDEYDQHRNGIDNDTTDDQSKARSCPELLREGDCDSDHSCCNSNDDSESHDMSCNVNTDKAQAENTYNKSKKEIPPLDEIVEFVKHIFLKGKLESECLITCLVYVERLMRHSSGRIRPHPTNWKSVLLSSLVLSSKVLDDLSMWNVDFSKIMSSYTCKINFVCTLERINALEICMLDSVGYHVKVSVSEYGKYYFLLRSMWLRSEEHDQFGDGNSKTGGDGNDDNNDIFQGAKLLEQSSAKYERTLLANSHSHHHAHAHIQAHSHQSNKRRTQSMNDCDMRHGRCFSPVVFAH